MLITIMLTAARRFDVHMGSNTDSEHDRTSLPEPPSARRDKTEYLMGADRTVDGTVLALYSDTYAADARNFIC